MGHGRYRLRNGVERDGRLLTCSRPLVATRVNESARELVAALSSTDYRSVDDVADAVGVEPRRVASLFESLRRRGLLEWRPERDERYRPPVSVVVTVRNETGTIEGCLDALANVSYPEYEVVVVDDGSTDGTRAAVRSHPLAESGVARLVTVEDAPLGIGACRNRGVAAARHDVVAFTDADCRPREEWLTDLVPCLRAHDAVGGRVRPHGDGRLSEYEGERASLDMGSRAAPVERASGTPYLATANLVARREVFEAVPFPERNVAEDVDVCWRALDAGYDVVYAADGVVEHDYGGLREFVSRRLSYGGSEALLAREYGHPGSVSVSVAPLLALAVFALGLGVGSAVGLTGVGAVVPALVGWGVVTALGSTGRTVVTALRAETSFGVRPLAVGLVRGGLSRLYALASEVSRYYSLPVAAVAVASAIAGFETVAFASALVAISTVFVPPLIEYAVRLPSLTAVEYVAWAALDDLSYQVGTYRGAVRHLSAVHLDPRSRFVATF